MFYPSDFSLRIPSTLSDDAIGVLRVAAPTNFAGVFIRELIKPFMHENPKVEVELILDYQNVDLVKDRIDIALRAGVEGSTLKDSSLIARKILKSQLALFCSPSLIESQGKLRTLDQVSDFDFIEFTSRSTFSFTNEAGETLTKADLTGRFKVNDVQACKAAAIAGLGIAVLPTFIAKDEVKNKQLVVLETDFVVPAVTIYAVYPSRQWIPAKLKVFLDHLKHLDDSL